MKSIEKTLETCRSCLSHDPQVKNLFEKFGESSGKGFLYEYAQDGQTLLMDLVAEEQIPVVTLYANADVLVKDEKLALVAKYCQLKSDSQDPGILVISPSYHYVFYRITIPVVGVQFSENTLRQMNLCAFEKIAACRDDLIKLTNDDLIVFHGTQERNPCGETERPAFSSDMLLQTKQLLAEELRNAQYDTLSRNTDEEDSTLFLTQFIKEDQIYYEKITLDESGFLLVSVRSDFKVSPELQSSIAVYCNQKNSIRKLAGLRAYSGDGYLWFSSPISLWDGPVGIDSIKLLEVIGTNAINEALSAIGEDENEDEDEQDTGFKIVGRDTEPSCEEDVILEEFDQPLIDDDEVLIPDDTTLNGTTDQNN